MITDTQGILSGRWQLKTVCQTAGVPSPLFWVLLRFLVRKGAGRDAESTQLKVERLGGIKDLRSGTHQNEVEKAGELSRRRWVLFQVGLGIKSEALTAMSYCPAWSQFGETMSRVPDTPFSCAAPGRRLCSCR